MTPGLRSLNSASVRVASADGFPEEIRELSRELLDLRSTDQRKGDASALLKQVCAEADAWWITLIVVARKYDDGMDDSQLLKWYEKFGFTLVQAEPPIMARTPAVPVIQRIN